MNGIGKAGDRTAAVVTLAVLLVAGCGNDAAQGRGRGGGKGARENVGVAPGERAQPERLPDPAAPRARFSLPSWMEGAPDVVPPMTLPGGGETGGGARAPGAGDPMAPVS